MRVFDSLTQQSHPRLWLAFQALFGATRDKRRIATAHLGNHRSVLEIGCSLGLVSQAFSRLPDIRYLGIDIDAQAIAHAQARFAGFPHMAFAAQSLDSLVEQGRTFDYVLFANILHHVDDALAHSLLSAAAKTVADAGVIVLMEPDILHAGDGPLIRALYRLERGEYRRPLPSLIALAEGAGIRIREARTRDIAIGLLPGVACGHMLVISGGA